MRRHPGDRVRLLIEARAEHVDGRDEAVGVIGGHAERDRAVLVHERGRVDRRGDALERPLFATDIALRRVAGVLRTETESVLQEVLESGLPAAHRRVVAVDRTADVEQVAGNADVLARFPAARDLVLYALVE